jgi:hypothetical protein
MSPTADRTPTNDQQAKDPSPVKFSGGVSQAQRFLAGTEPLILPVSKDMAEEEGRGQAVVDRALQAATSATALSKATRDEEQRLFEQLQDLRRV